MNFITIAFLLGGFLLIVSFILLYFSRNVPDRMKDGSVKVISMKNMILLFAILHFALANIAVLIGSGEAMFLVNQSPCENIVNQSEDISSTITQYTYEDSCATRTIPAAAENLHVIFTYLLYIELVLVFIGMIFATIYSIFSRW